MVDIADLAARESLVVAIDGPSGSGKSSVSKETARQLHAQYLDTGAMYRAATWWCLDQAINLEDKDLVVATVLDGQLEFSTSPDQEFVRVNGIDVTEDIRTERVSQAVSAVASIQQVRDHLIALQRSIIEAAPRIVAEGRDITTVVAPDANARILLTASEEARLARRGLQLSATATPMAEGAQASSYSKETLKQIVTERDKKDSATTSFTEAADGVDTVDSTELDFAQTVDAVLASVARQVTAKNR
ncbi:(d)CMP kinase [Neomicrococcus aestuarii]|uniref:Cytidylate kinase n=1 Tax=Neomicrococcus aestuarii TaxID=556325 RepID=A0A1L2ZM78_9MICC|nr:(d)CMP kinase [Neomicrococcus aestuarii]APF40246.1 cytidylate kinase [Neomicrococcus aestuarii]